MFNITISDEKADALFREILIQDYRGLRDDINRLEGQKNIDALDAEDLANNRKYLAAMEGIMEYYIFDWQKVVA